MPTASRAALVPTLLALAVCAGADARAANLSGGNGVYHIKVADGQQPAKCGVWAASTGPLHEIGSGRPLFGAVNSAFPLESSYTTFHSHNTGLNYTTNAFCLSLCVFVGPPNITPIVRAGTTVGYRLSWTFEDTIPVTGTPGAVVEFAQEIVVEGPVDGSETAENSLVRETHIVTNLGPGRFSFGLRKLRDLLVGDDWGPWLGDCETPAAACDVSMNLTRYGPQPYPRNVVFNAVPAFSICPAGIPPIAAGGCGGQSSYIVAATVQPPSGLVPRPHPPQVLQFNSWGLAAGSCWIAGDLQNDAECTVDDANCHPVFDPDCGTALAYYYGATAQTAHLLGPGQSRDFTQYLAASLGDCPELLTAVPAGP